MDRQNLDGGDRVASGARVERSKNLRAHHHHLTDFATSMPATSWTTQHILFLLPLALLVSSPQVFAFTATMSSTRMLSPVSPADVSMEIKDPVDPTALGQAKDIIAELRPSPNGAVDAAKLLEVAKRLGDIPADHAGSYTVSAEDCKKAFDGLAEADRSALVNIHQRVKTFAEAQRKSVTDIEIDIPGGKAGHTVSPCRGMFHIVAVYCVCSPLHI